MADAFDYIVIGSGAGGGPLAANLAQAGFRVLVLEAGGEYFGEHYAVPALHGQATQDPEMRWDFWVRHYDDDAAQIKDSKYYRDYPKDGAGNGASERVDGVLYPRSSTLGGCTAHNAMITVYPHDSDWRHLQQLTGDASWAPEEMRRYFERLERCQYLDSPEPESRHGATGWLATELADPTLALRDPQVLRLIAESLLPTLLERVIGESLSLEELKQLLALKSTVDELLRLWKTEGPAAAKRHPLYQKLIALLDINDARVAGRQREGVYLVPLATNRGVRNGSRERLLQVRRARPASLEIRTHCVVTRILFKGKRAVGVEYVSGNRLYQASPAPEGGRPAPGAKVRVDASREVIVAGGAFNSPQLLMLSGIGPREQLEAHGIDPVLEGTYWEGVGKNLHDRYEVAVIYDMDQDFTIAEGCRFNSSGPGEQPDPCMAEWLRSKGGVYSTNGAVISIVRKSAPGKPDPDQFIFGLPAYFKGYFPEYDDQLVGTEANKFSWVILQAHTRNRGGEVTLRSADPFERPAISFRYFQEGTDTAEDDLTALCGGVEFVREMMERSGIGEHVRSRCIPPARPIDTSAEIAEAVVSEAWGHHACGTCRIGQDPDAVLDSEFRVRGLDGIRVVDASVFPAIPGFFIVSAVYMIAEKASDVILRDAGRSLWGDDLAVAWNDLPPGYWQAAGA